jgi:hypothetical protein
MKYQLTIIFTIYFLSCQESNRYLQNIPEEENVKEVVFRLQIEHGRVDDIYYLSFTSIDSKTNKLIDSDPSGEFIHRFNGLPQKVKPVSQCDLIDFFVKDKITGEKGIILRIRSVSWLSETEALIESSSYRGPLDAGGINYKVQFQNNKWKIVSSEAMWVS